MQDSEQIKLKASREQKKDLCPCKPTSEFTDVTCLTSLFTIPFKQGNVMTETVRHLNSGEDVIYGPLQGAMRDVHGAPEVLSSRFNSML